MSSKVLAARIWFITSLVMAAGILIGPVVFLSGKLVHVHSGLAGTYDRRNSGIYPACPGSAFYKKNI